VVGIEGEEEEEARDDEEAPGDPKGVRRGLEPQAGEDCGSVGPVLELGEHDGLVGVAVF
jgi:hypothetical protein